MVQVNDSLYLVESVVRLGKLGLQQALAERQHGCLLLRLGDAQVGNVAAAVKQRLRERPYRTKQPVARQALCSGRMPNALHSCCRTPVPAQPRLGARRVGGRAIATALPRQAPRGTAARRAFDVPGHTPQQCRQ